MPVLPNEVGNEKRNLLGIASLSDLISLLWAWEDQIIVKRR